MRDSIGSLGLLNESEKQNYPLGALFIVCCLLFNHNLVHQYQPFQSAVPPLVAIFPCPGQEGGQVGQGGGRGSQGGSGAMWCGPLVQHRHSCGVT